MLLRQIVEILTPTTCASCGREGKPLCSLCIKKMAFYRENCYVCGLSSAKGATCAHCLSKTALSGVIVGTIYEDAAKELIWQLKFHRSWAAADAMAAVLLRRLNVDYQFDSITAVPIAPSRYRERGYNQAELIAKRLAQHLKLPYRPLLIRFGSHHQVGQSRSERINQISGAFVAKRQLSGESVLVVDDVITTGATLAECASVLREAGASSVWGAAAARGK